MFIFYLLFIINKHLFGICIFCHFLFLPTYLLYVVSCQCTFFIFDSLSLRVPMCVCVNSTDLVHVLCYFFKILFRYYLSIHVCICIMIRYMLNTEEKTTTTVFILFFQLLYFVRTVSLFLRVFYNNTITVNVVCIVFFVFATVYSMLLLLLLLF